MIISYCGGVRRVLIPGLIQARRDVPPPRPIEPHDNIPQTIRRVIEGSVSIEDRKNLERPRVILSTTLTRESPGYSLVEQATRPTEED
jgi:hypothetical protein